MKKKISIAVDAMGGENAPKKNIDGLDIFFVDKYSIPYAIELNKHSPSAVTECTLFIIHNEDLNKFS